MKELSDKEFNWMKKLGKEIDKSWDDLTDWEKKFMEDILSRFSAYGKRLLISKYQREKIGQISEKIIG